MGLFKRRNLDRRVRSSRRRFSGLLSQRERVRLNSTFSRPAPQSGEEALHRGRRSILAHPENASPFQIVDQRQVLLPLAAAHLVDLEDMWGLPHGRWSSPQRTAPSTMAASVFQLRQKWAATDDQSRTLARVATARASGGRESEGDKLCYIMFSGRKGRWQLSRGVRLGTGQYPPAGEGGAAPPEQAMCGDTNCTARDEGTA